MRFHAAVYLMPIYVNVKQIYTFSQTKTRFTLFYPPPYLIFVNNKGSHQIPHSLIHTSKKTEDFPEYSLIHKLITTYNRPIITYNHTIICYD